MTHYRTTREVEGIKLGFEWHGGAYIGVCQGESYAHPVEVINVWDYAKNAPRIDRTREAFNNKVDDWVGEYGRENLAHDVRENWRWY